MCNLFRKYNIISITKYLYCEMFHYIMLLIIKASTCLPDRTCDRIHIENNWYDKQILWADHGKPYSLNVHKTSNILFFSYSVPETYSDVDFQLVNLNIDTREYQNIPGIKGGCTTAVDQGNDEVYLGGSDGIYKYNMATKLADFYNEKDKNIWALFHRRNLFYISYPEQKLHIEIDGKFAIVKEFIQSEIDQFYMTRDDDIYFANKTGFYFYNKTIQNSEVLNDLLTVRQITEDNNGKIYACTNFGVFSVKKSEDLKKVLDKRNVYGLAFDKDNNFVFSDDRHVVRLMKSNESCVDDDHW